MKNIFSCPYSTWKLFNYSGLISEGAFSLCKKTVSSAIVDSERLSYDVQDMDMAFTLLKSLSCMFGRLQQTFACISKVLGYISWLNSLKFFPFFIRPSSPSYYNIIAHLLRPVFTIFCAEVRRFRGTSDACVSYRLPWNGSSAPKIAVSEEQSPSEPKAMDYRSNEPEFLCFVGHIFWPSFFSFCIVRVALLGVVERPQKEVI